MIRKLVLLPAAVTSMFAIAQLYFTLSDAAIGWWMIIRMIAALAVLAMGWLTLSYANNQHTSEHQVDVLQNGAMGLILLGFVGATLAFQNGQATGDFEYYLFMADALLIGQGLFTLFILRLENQSRQAA